MAFRSFESYRSELLILLAQVDIINDLLVVCENLIMLCVRRSIWLYCPLCKFKFALCDEVNPIDVRLPLKIHMLTPCKIDRFHKLKNFLNAICSEALKYPELSQKFHCALQSSSFLLAYDPNVIFPRQNCETAVCLTNNGRSSSLIRL